MVLDIKTNMKVCSNGHQSDSEYDSDSEYEYDSYSDDSLEYDSDMSSGERYEMHRNEQIKFISWWRKNNAASKQISNPIVPTPVAPTVTKPVVCIKKEFSWKVAVDEVVEIKSLIIDQKKNDNAGEWTTVKDKKKEKKEQVQVTVKCNTRSKMCDSVAKRISCRHGANCKFAHSGSELGAPVCSYGKDCSFVKASSDISVYRNIHHRKICGRLHPNETDETFYTRTTGIKKCATEEEMNDSFLVFLEELKKPAPKVSAPKKSVFVKYQQPQIWPSSFEKFKEIELRQLVFIARINNIQSHYQVKTNRRHISRPKTVNMLFLELIKVVEKNYNVGKNEIQAFKIAIQKKENHIKNVLNKNKNTKDEDIKTIQIREKNLLTIEIRRLANTIENNEKTIGRLSNIKENKEFYKNKIQNISSVIKTDKGRLEVMEKQLVDFQDFNKFEEYLNSKKVVEKVKVQEVAKVQEVVISKKSEPIVTITFVPRKEDIKILVTVEDEGWIKVIDNKRVKNVTPVAVVQRVCESVIKGITCRHGDKCRFSHVKPVNVEAVPQAKIWSNMIKNTIVPFKPLIEKVAATENNKTKMCDSVSKGISCRHGFKCRFAHSKKELVLRKCRYGDKCYNINTCEFAH